MLCSQWATDPVRSPQDPLHGAPERVPYSSPLQPATTCATASNASQVSHPCPQSTHSPPQRARRRGGAGGVPGFARCIPSTADWGAGDRLRLATTPELAHCTHSPIATEFSPAAPIGALYTLTSRIGAGTTRVRLLRLGSSVGGDRGPGSMAPTGATAVAPVGAGLCHRSGSASCALQMGQ